VPKDLAALLVEEGAVPADAVERALARQREAGGALDTALLEQGAVSEEALLGCLARAAELPAAPPAAWSGSDARARRVFPSRVAERHGLAPFALDGRELSLVATYPVDVGLLDEISFMLSLHLTAHVGPEWRVRELIHRLYGSPLPPRLTALAVAAGAAPRSEPDEAPPADAPAAAGTPPSSGGFGRDDSEPLEPLAAALAQALESVESFAFEDVPSDAEGGEEPEGEAAEEEPPPPDRTAPPRWSLEDARAALAAARHRDEVVVVALRYARDFFEFAAMFAVTRDAVAGHDALGPEEARERARSVAIWSSDPGIFKTVIETQSPYLGPVASGVAGTDVVLHGLGRTPRTVLVYPVLLRNRPVCILYADNGEAPVSARRLGDLLLFLSTVGATFERIIRARKKVRRRRSGAAPAAEPVSPEAPIAPPASGAPGPEAASTPGPAPAPEEPPAAEAVPALEGSPGEDGLAGTEEPPAPAGPRSAATAAAGEPAPSPEPAPPREPAPAAEHAPPREAAPRQAQETDPLAALEARFFSGGGAAGEGAPAPGSGGSEPSSRPEAAAAVPAAAPPTPAPARRAPPAPESPAPPVAGPPDASTLAALADRALDPDPDVAGTACAALERRKRDPALRPATEKLRRALLSGISVRAGRAARAIGALRDVEAIPLLIQVLETSEPETARAAADALAAITLQRLGVDARRWLAWWKENRGRGRAEWLFSGLTAAERETRVAASVELSLAAPPPVAYSADMPAAEREKVARAWAGWWARSGNVL
jgi:hypothetical protein